MKLIILSLDAVGFDDLADNKNLFQNIHKIINEGALIKNISTVSPSLSYPAHTTIITGEFPSVHNIEHNIAFQPFTKYPKWNWFYKSINSPTLIDILSEQKKKTTALHWPVTAGAKISKCIPKIWDNRTNNISTSLTLKNSTFSFFVKDALKHRKLLINDTISLDKFTYNIFMDIIKNDKLDDLSLVHFNIVDNIKHLYGNESAHTKNAFSKLDTYIGNIYEEVKKLEDVTLAIVSTHTQIDAINNIDIEKIFKEHSLLSNNDYVAYPRLNGGSCYVHIKNKSQKQQIKNKLRKICTTTQGINKLYDLEEITDISNQADFLIDASDGFYFGKKSENVSQHGYHSKRENYNVFLALAGKNIAKVQIENGHIINHAKTFARILDIEFNYGPGQCIDEVFKN